MDERLTALPSRRAFLCGGAIGAAAAFLPAQVLNAGLSSASASTTASTVTTEASLVESAVATSTFEVLKSTLSYNGQVGTLYRPSTTGRRPVVYFVHGGAWVRGSRHEYDTEARYWAAHGWVAVTLDYHLGVDYRRQLKDVRAAIRLVEHKAYAGTDRQVIVGDSAGGHLAALTAVRHPEHFVGQILWSPVVSPLNAYRDGGLSGASTSQQKLRADARKVIKGRWLAADPSLEVTSATPPLWIAGSSAEFVPWKHHGGRLVAALDGRAQAHLADGSLHGRQLQHGALRREARAWAKHLTS